MLPAAHRRDPGKAGKSNPVAISSSTAPAGDWGSRLIERRYSDLAKLTPGRELSVLIEHGGIRFFFPLGTNEPDQAARRAKEINATVIRDGWSAACEKFIRETAVAVFWNWSPLACTYTTIQTFPRRVTPPALPIEAQAKAHCAVLLIEPEANVRRAMAYWLNLAPGFRCARACRSIEEATKSGHQRQVHLILASRSVLEPTGRKGVARLRDRFLNVPLFSFGVYEESNFIFHSVSGVTAGYLLRRRPPRQLLDPIARLGREPTLPEPALRREIQRYFQSLFELPAEGQVDPILGHLTGREGEILLSLSKGYTDKEIADSLRISVWTVHGHVKKVFEKLRVHSRTEAVVKFLQK